MSIGGEGTFARVFPPRDLPCDRVNYPSLGLYTHLPLRIGQPGRHFVRGEEGVGDVQRAGGPRGLGQHYGLLVSAQQLNERRDGREVVEKLLTDNGVPRRRRLKVERHICI